MALNLIPNSESYGYSHKRTCFEASLNDLACMIKSKYDDFMKSPSGEYVNTILSMTNGDRIKELLNKEYVKANLEGVPVHDLTQLLTAYETFFTACKTVTDKSYASHQKSLFETMFKVNFKFSGIKSSDAAKTTFFNIGVGPCGRDSLYFVPLSGLVSALMRRLRMWHDILIFSSTHGFRVKKVGHYGGKSAPLRWEELNTVKDLVKVMIDTFPEPLIETVQRKVRPPKAETTDAETETIYADEETDSGETEESGEEETGEETVEEIQFEEVTISVDQLVKTLTILEEIANEQKRAYFRAHPEERKPRAISSEDAPREKTRFRGSDRGSRGGFRGSSRGGPRGGSKSSRD